MKAKKTIVEVESVVLNKSTDEEETVKKYYYLLHWGIAFRVDDYTQGPVALQFTVGICQEISTGQVYMFSPNEIRVLGTEIDAEIAGKIDREKYTTTIT